MFYFLSKIIGLFLNPVVWVVILLILSMLTKQKIRAKRLRLSGIITLLLFTNTMFFNETIRLWETDSKKNTPLNKTYDIGIVLSGMTHYNADLNRTNYLRSSDRLWQAVKLYQERKINKILITGGAASLFSTDTVEAAFLGNFIEKMGIPRQDIIIEDLAKNTYENAQFTARILDTLNYSSLLLVTSASHMRRSNACFKKAGLSCDLYPTDHYTRARNYHIDQVLIPSAKTLDNWVQLFHEFFGIISYKISGYI